MLFRLKLCGAVLFRVGEVPHIFPCVLIHGSAVCRVARIPPHGGEINILCVNESLSLRCLQKFLFSNHGRTFTVCVKATQRGTIDFVFAGRRDDETVRIRRVGAKRFILLGGRRHFARRHVCRWLRLCGCCVGLDGLAVLHGRSFLDFALHVLPPFRASHLIGGQSRTGKNRIGVGSVRLLRTGHLCCWRSGLEGTDCGAGRG